MNTLAALLALSAPHASRSLCAWRPKSYGNIFVLHLLAAGRRRLCQKAPYSQYTYKFIFFHSIHFFPLQWAAV